MTPLISLCALCRWLWTPTHTHCSPSLCTVEWPLPSFITLESCLCWCLSSVPGPLRLPSSHIVVLNYQHLLWLNVRVCFNCCGCNGAFLLPSTLCILLVRLKGQQKNNQNLSNHNWPCWKCTKSVKTLILEFLCSPVYSFSCAPWHLRKVKPNFSFRRPVWPWRRAAQSRNCRRRHFSPLECNLKPLSTWQVEQWSLCSDGAQCSCQATLQASLCNFTVVAPDHSQKDFAIKGTSRIAQWRVPVCKRYECEEEKGKREEKKTTDSSCNLMEPYKCNEIKHKVVLVLL